MVTASTYNQSDNVADGANSVRGASIPAEVLMSSDGRDILEVLKFELNFLEQGGYGRSVRTPWKPTSIFQDSVSCINFGDPERTNPCGDCLLNDFVPNEYQCENVPCHHIPLNPSGETVDTMERQYNQS